ncbi:MAG TPA: ATP-binding protein, partial [Spirochaetia bacterium]
SIIANADLLLMDAAVSGGVREVVEEIEMASYRAADLTQRLLSFSRKQTPEQKMIDLNVAVADVEKMLRRIIGEDIRLSCFLEAPSATVLAAPAQIEQILLNLAINARDAMPEGGSITIATSSVARPKGGTGGDRVCLSVTDTGCGMPDDVKSHLFEPFFTTKDPGRGTGLGLATVYGIVQQMGGEISVDSAVGRGTTVLVTFPIASGIAGSGGVATPQAPVTRGCGDIIVAEDDETLLKVIVKTLQTGGYSVHGFSDPLEALRFATTEATRVDLLVADLVMPSMSGVQLASGVLEAWAGAKLLYISGYPGELDRKAACPIAGDGYLSKPFTLAELTLKVREVLGGTRPPGRPES